MLTTNLAFEEWTEIFGTERLRGLSSTDSLSDATSWKPMGRGTDCYIGPETISLETIGAAGLKTAITQKMGG